MILLLFKNLGSNNGLWTLEEDDTLLEAIKHGGKLKFKDISSELLKNGIAQACQFRFLRIDSKAFPWQMMKTI